MKERYFKFARAASMTATYTGSHRFSPMIGACAVYKGTIVATASNSNKTSPLQAKYNIYRFIADTPDKSHQIGQKFIFIYIENIRMDNSRHLGHVLLV